MPPFLQEVLDLTWAMLAATSGSRLGLTACLVLASLLDVGFALLTYLFLCPPASCNGFPNLWPWTWAQLILGLLAAIALVFQLTGKKVVDLRETSVN
jgi:hypothetical protein